MKKRLRNAMSEITIIGGCNIDIEGSPDGKLIRQDSNIGKINIAYGGVGRNICENVARMGGSVSFLSVIGDDAWGKGAIEMLAALGVDTSAVKRIEGESTSMYLCVMDENSDMEVGINDMDIVKHITPEYLKEHENELKASKVAALDGNLEEDIIRFATDMLNGVKLFYDPVSKNKAYRAKNVIGRFYAVKPNLIEAEVLTGMTINGEEDVKRAGRILLDKGVRMVFITLNKDGVYFVGKNDDEKIDEGFLRPLPGITPLSTTGCGDSFSACVLLGIAAGMNIRQIAELGMAASSVTIQSESAVNPEINMELVRGRMAELIGQEKDHAF